MIAGRLNHKNILIISLFSVAFAAILLFYIVLYNTTRNIVGTWQRSELLSIQQGNYLSSVSKYQRVLPFSNYIKGITVFDRPNNNRKLISIGSEFDIKQVLNIDSEIEVFLTPSGVAFAFLLVGNRNDLVVGFKIESLRLKITFLIFSLILFNLILIFYFLTRRIEKINLKRELELRTRSLTQFNHLAHQVVHDIRAPLSALKIIGSKMGCSDGMFSLLQSATTRIELIADELLKSGRKRPEDSRKEIDDQGCLEPSRDIELSKISIFEVNDLINSIIQEFLISLPSQVSLKFEKEKSLMAGREMESILINKLQLGRALSNLLTNSIESIESRGEVNISVGIEKNLYQTIVSDNGVGLTKEQLSNIGKRGLSWGKARGNGLGVYGAKKTIHGFGGEFHIASTYGKGTRMTILIPLIPLKGARS